MITLAMLFMIVLLIAIHIARKNNLVNAGIKKISDLPSVYFNYTEVNPVGSYCKLSKSLTVDKRRPPIGGLYFLNFN